MYPEDISTRVQSENSINEQSQCILLLNEQEYRIENQ